jgi:hypothetical protein
MYCLVWKVMLLMMMKGLSLKIHMYDLLYNDEMDKIDDCRPVRDVDVGCRWYSSVTRKEKRRKWSKRPKETLPPTSHRILTTKPFPQPLFQQISPFSLFLLISSFFPSTPLHEFAICLSIGPFGSSCVPSCRIGIDTGKEHIGQSGVIRSSAWDGGD